MKLEVVPTVATRGAGEKAFCAGGDIRAITEVPGGDLQRQFFMEEYQLDHLVGTYSLPYVAILNGIVMGGAFYNQTAPPWVAHRPSKHTYAFA